LGDRQGDQPSAFDTWVETQLAPTLTRGDLVILANLAVHKDRTSRATPPRPGVWFLFLPRYSPDLNPHRAGLRQTQGTPARRRSENLRRTLEGNRQYLVSLQQNECWNYLKEAGYASD